MSRRVLVAFRTGGLSHRLIGRQESGRAQDANAVMLPRYFLEKRRNEVWLYILYEKKESKNWEYS